MIFDKVTEFFIKNNILDLTIMMSMVNLVAIGLEIPNIASGCCLEKEFIELIPMKF